MDKALKTILDRQVICDLLNCYCWSLDDHAWERLATCFLPEAVGYYGEEIGEKVGYQAIEQLCRSALTPLDSSQHMISNIEIELGGDTARSRCYLQAQHYKAGTPGGDNFTLGGYYRDELVRTSEGWKIKRRELHTLWVDGNPAVLDF